MWHHKILYKNKLQFTGTASLRCTVDLVEDSIDDVSHRRLVITSD